tara:strand:- start:1742 stop:2287 length:546 start_codon:yes stop_codon:yes gene_type:complete
LDPEKKETGQTGLATKVASEFNLSGVPVSQVRHSIALRNGKPRAFYKSKKFIEGKKNALEQLRLQMLVNQSQVFMPAGVPVALDLLYIFPRPKRLQTKKAEAGFIPHVTKPDIDNCDKLYLDCLSGIAIHDDNQVYQINSKKVFCSYDFKTKTESWVGVRIVVKYFDDENSRQLLDNYLPW